MVFGPTDPPKIIQNHKKTRSKNRLVSGIDFGPLFLTFGLPKAPKSAPKSSQNAPKCLPTLDKNRFFGRPGPKMLQNDPEDPKSHHFGLQNDRPELKKRPPNDPRAQKLLQNDIRTSNFPLHTSHVALHTSRFALPTSHFTLRTSHFTLRTLHFALHTSHFTLRTSHFTLHTSHFALHT